MGFTQTLKCDSNFLLTGVCMNTDRFVIGDDTWERIAQQVPGKASARGGTGADTRLFLEAVLWRVRTGSPWRDLPSAFGNWNSTFRRFRCWRIKEHSAFKQCAMNIRDHRAYVPARVTLLVSPGQVLLVAGGKGLDICFVDRIGLAAGRYANISFNQYKRSN